MLRTVQLATCTLVNMTTLCMATASQTLPLYCGIMQRSSLGLQGPSLIIVVIQSNSLTPRSAV
jgi:hypothetical protein